MNIIRLTFFPFSLKDKVKTWVQNLRSESIRTWDEMQAQFLKKKNFDPIEQIISKDKSPYSLKNREKSFTNVGIGIKSYLTFTHTTVLKHGD